MSAASLIGRDRQRGKGEREKEKGIERESKTDSQKQCEGSEVYLKTDLAVWLVRTI